MVSKNRKFCPGYSMIQELYLRRLSNLDLGPVSESTNPSYAISKISHVIINEVVNIPRVVMQRLLARRTFGTVTFRTCQMYF